ncbi:unnamed protein product [Rotaria sp. Silwood2]|nr:unnamed protein product [Rotaria sp. Silwood2]
MSWTDNTHNQLHIEPNTSGIYIDKCYKQFEYLIASCSLINRYHNQLYECHPIKKSSYYLYKRLKRSIDNKSKRSPQVILSFIIGISCFLIGFIIGTVIAIFISIKRQQLNTDIRSLNINNEISNRSSFPEYDSSGRLVSYGMGLPDSTLKTIQNSVLKYSWPIGEAM